MADSAVAVTAGSGTSIDTRTEGTNGNHRQVIVIGDPATNAGVAPVDVTAGLKVDLGADNDVTVSGTVTAELSATDNAVLDDIAADTESIKTAVEILDNAISGSEMQVDVVTSALPSGASTSAKQDTIIGHLDGVEGLLTTIDTDTGTLAGAVSGTEMQVDVVAALPAGTNAIGKLAANSGVDIGDVDVTTVIPGTGATNLGKAEDAAHSSGDTGVMALGVRRDSPTVSSGTAGDYEPVSMDANGATWVSLATKLDTTNDAVAIGPRTSGGLSIHRSLDLDESEEEVKATAGQVYGWFITNLTSSTRYIKFYNATAANVTVGTTTPVMTIPLEADQASNVEFTNGIAFGTAISVAATTGIADNDTGAPGANEVVVNIFYK